MVILQMWVRVGGGVEEEWMKKGCAEQSEA
jgi:hypothetical protein